MNLLNQVRDSIERETLLPPGATAVVGVSGGADSLCLLDILDRLSAEFGWSLHVAHLNHCLRGDEADDDMAFVALLALQRGLPCTVQAIDVRAVARQNKQSVEEAARQVRYGFLLETARRVGAQSVAVGHNADDQSETVLMHFLRGAGLAGLRGMSPVTDLTRLRTLPNSPVSQTTASPVHLVRPLLGAPRTEIEGYCRERHLLPRFDRSNLDTTYSRNRLRHELLPLLESYNPNIRTLLRRTAAVATADYALITASRDAAWSRVVRKEDQDTILFDRDGWRDLPLALQRATLRKAAYHLRPQLRDVDFCHIEHAVDVAARGRTGAQAVLPGGLGVEVGYRNLRLSSQQTLPTPPDWPLLWHEGPVQVTLPGEIALPDSLWRLETHVGSGDPETARHNPDRWLAYIDADQLGEQLALRSRQPGDRFHPLGMDGRTVKIADWMINAKIPRRWRENIPLLVHRRTADTMGEQIAWVVGWRTDERVQVTQRTRRVAQFQFLRENDEAKSELVDRN